MNEDQNREIEQLLKSLPQPSLPRGLKQRTLAGMARRNAERSLLSPRLRACFVGLIFVMITAIAGDAFLSQKEAVRMAAMFPTFSRPEASAEDPILKVEIYAAFPNAENLLQKRLRQGDDGSKLRPLRAAGRRKIEWNEEETDGLKN